MLKFLLVLMTAYLMYSLHKEIKVHRFKWKSFFVTALFLIVGIGVGVDSQQANYSPTDVQSMQQKYIRVSEKEQDAKDKHSSLIKSESKAFGQRDKTRNAYDQKRPQFKKEAYQRKQARVQKKQQEKVEREQQKEQQEEVRQQQKQQARVSKQQQMARAHQADDPKSRTVWIAPEYGTKYHYNPHCPGLNRANSKQKITEQQAIAAGYKLCKFEGGH